MTDIEQQARAKFEAWARTEGFLTIKAHDGRYLAPETSCAERGWQAALASQRDREADRRRFPDTAFNRWLDEPITENGEFTMWHQLGDTCDAWHGWCARPLYPNSLYPGGPFDV